MPIDDGNGYGSIMCYNGVPIGAISDVETVTIAEDSIASKPYYLPHSISFMMKWHTDRVSRKRFCRELQKIGFTKKESKAVAWKVRKKYAHYLSTIRLCGREYVLRLLGRKQ